MPPLEPMMLGHLYRRHAPVLRLYARQWTGVAEDLVHDAFVQLARQDPPPERVLPWLYQVVRNQARAHYRGASRRRQREQQAGSSEIWFSSVDDQLDAQEATRLLAELAIDLREVIIARLWAGLTFEEIAGLVGCSLPTAHRRYQSGLLALRERLQRPCSRTTNPMT